MTIIEPVEHVEYRAGYERFVALGDDAVRRLHAASAATKEERCPTP